MRSSSLLKKLLQKFCNPSMYKVPPKRDLAMSEKFGYEFTQINVHSYEAPPNEKLAALTDGRAVLTKGFAELDSQVKEASYNHKEEHEDYTVSMQQDAAAQEIIKFAKKVVTELLQPVHVQGITKA